MAKRQRQSELRGCLGGLGYEERRALWGGYVCMCVCVCDESQRGGQKNVHWGTL